jgi:hypothetical protein
LLLYLRRDEMVRHRLSKAELLEGAEEVLRKRSTPKQLRPGLSRLRDRLRRELDLAPVRAKAG